MKRHCFLRGCLRPLAIICISLPSLAQTGYQAKYLLFQSGENARYFNTYSDYAGAILIDGYLKGKLKAYAADVVSEVVKRGPIDSTEIPSPWEKGIDYYTMDRVSYQGKYYEATLDFASNGLPPDQNKYWLRYEILGEPVSVKRSYPQLKDTLGKGDFLAKLVSQLETQNPPWDLGGAYYNGDLVDYRGITYIATKDVTSAIPPAEDGANWDIYGSAGPTFLRPRDLIGLRTLLHTEKNQGNVRYTPQMVSPVAFKYELELNYPVVYFFFDEAVNYLNSIAQPVLFSSQYGYLTNGQFVLTPEARAELLESVRASLKSKTLKLTIQNPERIKIFLNDTTRMANTTEWVIHQNLNSTDLEIHQVVFEGGILKAKSVAAIPLKSLQKALPFKAASWFTPWEVLVDQGRWESTTDTLAIDSLAPVNPHINARKPANSFLLLEAYKANVDDTNPSLTSTLPEAWAYLTAAYNEMKPVFKTPFVTFFPWVYDWSTVKPGGVLTGWTFNKNFTLGPSGYVRPGVLEVPKQFTTLSVTYKKTIPTDPKQKMQYSPLEVTLEFQTAQNPDAPVWYTVAWKDFKELLTSRASAPLAQLIQAIEGGTLRFYNTELVYAPIENK